MTLCSPEIINNNLTSFIIDEWDDVLLFNNKEWGNYKELVLSLDGNYKYFFVIGEKIKPCIEGLTDDERNDFIVNGGFICIPNDFVSDWNDIIL